MWCKMSLQNVSFFFHLIIFSGVSSGMNINFCSNLGLSSGHALSRDSLDSSNCMAGKLFWAL